MKHLFWAVAAGALLSFGCGAGSTFAPSLREQPVVEHQFPWWNSTAASEEQTPEQPTARQDYESPVRANCMEITHSGRWRLPTDEDRGEILEGLQHLPHACNATILVTDHGWTVAITRLNAETPAEEVRQIEDQSRIVFSLLTVFAAPFYIEGHPEQFEGLSDTQAMDQAIARLLAMMNIELSPVFEPEHSQGAASFRIRIHTQTIQVYGMLTDYENPASGVIVTGFWNGDEHDPIPLMDLTQIAHELRVIENCEAEAE